MHSQAYTHHTYTYPTCTYTPRAHTHIYPQPPHMHTYTQHIHTNHAYTHTMQTIIHLNANFKTMTLEKENKGKIFLRLEVKQSDINITYKRHSEAQRKSAQKLFLLCKRHSKTRENN